MSAQVPITGIVQCAHCANYLPGINANKLRLKLVKSAKTDK